MMRKLWKPPSRKFAKEASVSDFPYSQTILLQFTVILCYSNLDEKVTSNKQKVTSDEQKVTSDEQIVTSKK